VVIDDFIETETIKAVLKAELEQNFSIAHSTLEFEMSRCGKVCCWVPLLRDIYEDTVYIL